MPTKIELKKASFPSKVVIANNNNNNNNNVSQQLSASPLQGQQQQQLSRNKNSNNNDPTTTTIPIPITPRQRVVAFAGVNNYNYNNTNTIPRSAMGFRSSILREFRSIDNNNNNNKNIQQQKQQQQNSSSSMLMMDDSSVTSPRQRQQQQQQQAEEENTVRLSKDDIRASPRLSGYMFTMMAAAVLLISAFQLYKNEYLESTTTDDNETIVIGGSFEEKFFVTETGRFVYRWKLWGAIYLSCVGLFLSFITGVVHFDTVLLPNCWIYIFKDGSLAERNWILFLIIFWGAGIHICTSTFSIGEVQPNVFFTAWIAFGSMVLNYFVWRESAGLLMNHFPSRNPTTTTTTNGTTITTTNNNNPSNSASPQGIISRVQEQQSTSLYDSGGVMFRRETTHNWLWTSFFSMLFAASSTDIYYNRAELILRFEGETLKLKSNDWVIILSVVWSEAFVCLLAIFLNEYFVAPNSNNGLLPCCRIRTSTGTTYRFVFGWRQLEGIVVLVSVGLKFWVILSYTGVDGVINGLSNAYFGIWGSFLNSVFTLGTWVRENKNIDYIITSEPTS